MSQKEKIIKQNSPKVNSEYLTTISSSNYQINQTLLSSNSKENKIRANAPQLKCTCNHPMPKTFQKQQLKCTCKVYKNNNINNMNSYKTESRQSRFDQMTSPIKYNTINNYMGMSGQKSVRSQSYRMDTLSSRSNNSRLVCTCKHKGNSNFNTIRTSSEIKRHINLWGQKTENLQILSAPAPLLTTQYVQNLAIIQNNPKPISVMIPVVKNEISYTNKIEIEGLPQIETKEIIPEKKVEEEKVVEKQEENLEEKQEEKVEEIEKEEKAEEKEEENEQEINEHEENEQEINEEENEQEINEHEENEQEINEEENEQEEKEQEEKEEEEKEQIEKEEIVEDKNEEIIEDNKEEENEEITEEKPEIIQEEVKEEEKPEEIPEVKEEEEKPNEKIEDIPEEVQEEKPEEKPEVKEEEKIVINDDYNKVKKISYTRRIRANIIRVQPQEESEKDSSSASDYDVLQKITKYKGDFKYKDLVNQSLDLIQRHSTKTKQKINIKTPSNASDNFEKLANTNVIRFTTIKTYEPDSKDMQSNEKDEKDVYEVPFSPDGLDNSPDIIQDHVQAPEDSPYPGELVSQNKLEEEKNNYQQPQNNNKNKNKAKFDNIDIINTQDSPIEKQYINMKIEQAVSKKKEINQVEEKSQEQDENNEPREEIKVNIGENNNNENEEHNDNNDNNDKESENENEHDVETYEIEENMDKNENNMGDVYFYNELVEEVEDKEKSEEKKEEIKQHLIESQESLEQKDEMPNENEIDDNDNDNIEEELGRYVEEQNNKKIQEKLDNERKKKIKVYNLIENKNLQTDENQEPNEIIVYIKSSVKTNKENNVIIDDNSNERGYSSSDGLDAEPKNSVVK